MGYSYDTPYNIKHYKDFFFFLNKDKHYKKVNGPKTRVKKSW